MQEMMAFVLWFVQEFPAILLQPPISAFVGMVLLLYIVRVISAMMRL